MRVILKKYMVWIQKEDICTCVSLLTQLSAYPSVPWWAFFHHELSLLLISLTEAYEVKRLSSNRLLLNMNNVTLWLKAPSCIFHKLSSFFPLMTVIFTAFKSQRDLLDSSLFSSDSEDVHSSESIYLAQVLISITYSEQPWDLKYPTWGCFA